MRFIAKPEPRLNTFRDVRRFLWLPLTIGRETRWLERVWIRQVYSAKPVYPAGTKHYWASMRFIDGEEEPIYAKRNQRH